MTKSLINLPVYTTSNQPADPNTVYYALREGSKGNPDHHFWVSGASTTGLPFLTNRRAADQSVSGGLILRGDITWAIADPDGNVLREVPGGLSQYRG